MSTRNESRSPNRLDGRVALISGGAQGIGRARATLFQREGGRVFIRDGDARTGTETAADLSGQNPHLPVKYLRADLREPREIQNAVETVRKLHGRVDILVNNAGVELDRKRTRLNSSHA